MNLTVAILLAVTLGGSFVEVFLWATFFGWLFSSFDLFGERS